MTLLEILGIVFCLVVIAVLVSPGRVLPVLLKPFVPILKFLSDRLHGRKDDGPPTLIFGFSDFEEPPPPGEAYVYSHPDDVEMACWYYPRKHREDYSERYLNEHSPDATEGEKQYFEEVTELDQWAGYREKPVFQKYREDLTWLWISPNTEVMRKSPVFFAYFLFPWRDTAISEWEKELNSTKGKGIHKVIHKNLGVTYLLEKNLPKALEHFTAYREAGVESWWEEDPLERLIQRLREDTEGNNEKEKA